MNTDRIEAKAKEIARYSKALEWLEQYGTQLSGEDGDGASFELDLTFAGSCEGANEASAVIESYARIALPDLVKQSIESCRNSINMARDAIREEIDQP